MSLLPAALAAALVVLVASALTSVPHRIVRHSHAVRESSASFRRTSRRRRPDRGTIEPAAVADWVDALARSLRRGSTLHAALAETVPADLSLRERSEPLRHRLTRGASVTDACDEWADRLAASHDRGADLLLTTASVIAAVSVVGGTAATPLDRVAAAMRRHVSEDLEREAHSAQARLSARVLTIVPLAVLALLLGTDDAVRSIVVSPTGSTIVVAGLAINGAGAFWMHSIAATTTARPRSGSASS